jgi:hypothetical protein
MVIFLLVMARETQNPVEGWAVLLETNDFPAGYTDLPVDFVDIERMQDMLEYHKWQKNHLCIKKDGISPEIVKEGIQYLEENADANDIALFYICSHGGYMRHDLQWNRMFPSLWDEIRTENRVLIIDSCYAGSFLPESDRPHIAIASVSSEESGWAGVPEEGLPIIGFVFTYYFCDVMKDDISVEEGFARTVPHVKEYMQTVVLPEFQGVYPPEDYNLYDPHPVMEDQYPGDLYLEVEYKTPVPVLLVFLGMLLVLKQR